MGSSTTFQIRESSFANTRSIEKVDWGRGRSSRGHPRGSLPRRAGNEPSGRASTRSASRSVRRRCRRPSPRERWGDIKGAGPTGCHETLGHPPRWHGCSSGVPRRVVGHPCVRCAGFTGGASGGGCGGVVTDHGELPGRSRRGARLFFWRARRSRVERHRHERTADSRRAPPRGLVS